MKRFWDKVDVKGPAECWLWKATKSKNGYGQFKLGGQMRLAHRVAYGLVTAPVPDGRVIRHTCDAPGCVNPAHLEVGSQADNLRDMVDRGRSAKGEKNGQATLNDFQVATIRMLYAGERPPTQKKLAEAFGVSHQTVCKIVTGQIWTHVPGPITRRRSA